MVERELQRYAAPGEAEARARAWEVARMAFAERQAAVPRSSHRRQLASTAAGMAVAALLVLSPAAATVGRLISRAFGVQHASSSLISLPASGRLLLSGAGGTWLVGATGSKHWVGAWTSASWSPHGRYLAVAGNNGLTAVTPSGNPQWTITRPAVSDPRWYAPSGYRVAYLSGSDLRVVAGDGTQDHLLAPGVAHLAPAWRPDHPYQLAYIATGGRLWVRDSDTGAVLWSARPRGAIRQLQWSSDGSRLVATSPRRVFVYSGNGRLLAARSPSGAEPIVSAALAPDGRTLAIVSGGSGGAALVYRLAAGSGSGSGSGDVRRVLAGIGLRQVAFSPNGRWLLVTWPAADQWVFIRVAGPPRIAAMSRITQHFASEPGSQFPRLEGWCCTARGAAG
jgi:hypothetical protein